VTVPGPNDALVLSGGGANGAYEVGVLKALFQGESPATHYRPLDPAVLTGTSIGAFNTALLLSRLDEGSAAALDYMEAVWRELIPGDPWSGRNRVFRYRINPFGFLTPYALADAPRRLAESGDDLRFLFEEGVRRGVNFFVSGGEIEERILQLIDVTAFISREPGERLVREVVEFERIRASRRKLRLVATNWRTGEVKVFQNEDMTEQEGPSIVLASSALPGVFPCVELSGDPYVDGGLSMNTPLTPAIDAGADVLHVIYLDPDVSRIPLQRLDSAIDTIDRVFTIQFAIKTNDDMETARRINHGLHVIERAAAGTPLTDQDARDFVRTAGAIRQRVGAKQPYRHLVVHRYHPRDDLSGPLGVLRFDPDHIDRLIERGYQDALLHDCEASECLLPPGGGIP
jgi:NTE family protein